MTNAPSAARRRAIARPMPRLAPVTRATLPPRRTISILATNALLKQMGWKSNARVKGNIDDRIAARRSGKSFIWFALYFQIKRAHFLAYEDRCLALPTTG